MRAFICLCIWLCISPHISAQTPTAPSVLSQAYAEAMQAVTTHELEAPAASRVYVLTAIALYDSYYIAKGETPYRASVRSADTMAPDALMRETTTRLLAHLFSDDARLAVTPPTTELSRLADDIATDIITSLPKPAAQIYIPEGQSEAFVHPEWRWTPPLELSAANMFRASGPPPPGSDRFLSDLKEVRIYGEDVSEYRLADASVSAAFWGNPAGTVTPPGHWNQIALQISESLPLPEQLSTLLALNVALYDACIAAWDTKYTFNAGRPDAYIRAHDLDNPKWTAMGTVPLHPEYVSGHSAFSGAAAFVLTDRLGTQPFCHRSTSMWKLERCFTSFNKAAEDAGQSRIYGGLHYQFSNQDGLTLGRNVGQNTLKKLTLKGIL